MAPAIISQSTLGSEKGISDMKLVLQQQQAATFRPATREMTKTNSGSNTAFINGNNYETNVDITKDDLNLVDDQDVEGQECGVQRMMSESDYGYSEQSDSQPEMIESFDQEDYLIGNFSLSQAKAEEKSSGQFRDKSATIAMKNVHVERWVQETLEACQNPFADSFQAEDIRSSEFIFSENETSQLNSFNIQLCCGITHDYECGEERAQLISSLENPLDVWEEMESQIEQLEIIEDSYLQPTESPEMEIVPQDMPESRVSALTRRVFEWLRKVLVAANPETDPARPDDVADAGLQGPEESFSMPRRRDSLRIHLFRNTFGKGMAEIAREMLKLTKTPETAEANGSHVVVDEEISSAEYESSSSSEERAASISELESLVETIDQRLSETETESEADQIYTQGTQSGDALQAIAPRLETEEISDMDLDGSSFLGFFAEQKPENSSQSIHEISDQELFERLFPNDGFSDVTDDETSILEYVQGAHSAQLIEDLSEESILSEDGSIDSEDDTISDADATSYSGSISTEEIDSGNDGDSANDQSEHDSREMLESELMVDRKGAVICWKDLLISDDRQEFFMDAVENFNNGEALLATQELKYAVDLMATPGLTIIEKANLDLSASGPLLERRKSLVFADELSGNDQENTLARRSSTASKCVLKKTRSRAPEKLSIKRYAQPSDEQAMKAVEKDIKRRVLVCWEGIRSFGECQKLSERKQLFMLFTDCFMFLRNFADEADALSLDYCCYLGRVRSTILEAVASVYACGDKLTMLADFINTSNCSMSTMEEVSGQAKSLLHSLRASDPLVEAVQQALTQLSIEDVAAIQAMSDVGKMFNFHANHFHEVHECLLRTSLAASMDVEKMKSLTGYNAHYEVIKTFQQHATTCETETAREIIFEFQSRIDELKELKHDLSTFSTEVLSTLDNVKRDLGVL
ncbi:hypothetical protein METSCH_C05160 [Metschnikowia aff. pulcherrima]|uniref:Uncharacterized protein n=1 Tax=Metschnikowia aff. pulcherrima TaxID=2163413 RepID=A0A4P6XPG0_9ASCO|nr:hypothetical protein METSCH_C05160 [Metschnikowia aff. pulcherrima]